MFWGLIMEPNKRYTQTVEKPFHISQAALDTSTGDNELCQVMVVVDDKNFLVCTLQKKQHIQVPLDLYFKTGDSIAFLTNGKCNIHLSGYLDPEFEEEVDEEEEDEEEEEEVPELVPAKNKRKLENTTDVSASKKPKQEKKAAKKGAAAESSDSEDDENHLQKLLDGDFDTDDNDDSFKMNSTGDASDDEEDSDEEGDEDDDEEAEVEEEDGEEESSEEADTTLDTSKEEKEVDMSKLTKSQKRRLKKKLARQAEEAKEQPQVNGVDKSKKEKLDAKAAKAEKAEKKKPEAKKTPEPVEKKEKKSLTGGVSIEDTKVGSGAVAKSGKIVWVHYEGRLKSNNKMFDNCKKGPGFKFRLGAKEVISGWDVGVNGMKVGGKRTIVCPPNMAYGAKGSAPVIPPNATLVFDVELKNVS